MFLIVSTSLAYINIPKSKSDPKTTLDKKITTTYTPDGFNFNHGICVVITLFKVPFIT